MSNTTEVRKTDRHSLAGKYFTFQLGNEIYGLEILKVREIIGLMHITQVPRTPQYIRGVINLRGKIIPVIDLRTKFGMTPTEDTEHTCIIVVDLATDESTCQMGVLVDSVSEVLDIKEENIEATPAFGGDMDARFIRGMAKSEDKVTILLDVEAVLNATEAQRMQAAHKEAATQLTASK